MMMNELDDDDQEELRSYMLAPDGKE